MSSQYLHTTSVNHIGSTNGQRLSRQPTPTDIIEHRMVEVHNKYNSNSNTGKNKHDICIS